MESSRRSNIPSSSGFAVPAARWTAVLALVMTAAYFAFKDAVPYLVAFSPKVYGPYWETRFGCLRNTAVLAVTYFLILSSTEIALQSRAVREAPFPRPRRMDDQAAFGSAGSSQLRFAHPPIGSD
jgi:hypothetical protein